MVDPSIALARFATYGLAMLLVGWAVFDAGIAPPLNPRRLPRTLAAVALSLSALAYLVLLAREAGGEPRWPPASLVVTLAMSTGFGRALLVTAFAGLELALWARPPLGLRVGMAGIALAALAFVGHAADGEGALGMAQLATMALHLLSVGAWLGALPALWLALRAPGPGAETLLRRFGALGVWAVAAMLATGVANAAFIAFETRGGYGPTYLGILAIKLAFVAGLLALAAVNRFLLMPRLGRDAHRAVKSLRRTVAAEQALGIAALAAVAVLGQLDPSM